MNITLPLPKSCNPNGSRGGHWAVKSKSRKAERRTAEMEARAALGRADAPRWPSGTIRVTWFARHPAHLPDEDNATARMKPYRDGLVDAGIFIDDKNIKPEYVPILDPKGKPRVMIEPIGPSGEFA